jgi:DNA repair exonuclease SbcCD ATPase subunit
MIRLRRLTINGFRGARFALQLDFTKDCRSLSIFGENASGKSTVTDALEWFLYGRIDHLWKEDCKESALRNVLCGGNDPCEVAVEFSEPALNGIKALGPDLRATPDKRPPSFQTFQEKAKGERIILRHAQITSIVGKPKGEKRKWIAGIIGYQAITEFRNAVQSARNALQGDSNYSTARQLAENAQSEMFKIAQRVIASRKDLFVKVNELVAPYKLGITITDKATYEQAVKALNEKISHPDFAKKKIRLDQLAKDCAGLAAKISALLSAKGSFLGFYNKLAGDRVAVSQLNIGRFLSVGRQVIESGAHTAPNCPFCLTPYELEKLREEVEARLEKIVEIQGQYEDSGILKTAFVRACETVIAACKAVSECSDFEKFRALASDAAGTAATVGAWITTVNDCHASFQPVAISEGDAEAVKSFAALAAAQEAVAASEGEALKLSEPERRLIETIQQLGDLKRQFMQYLKNSRTVQAYEAQILSLSTIFDRFVPVQNDALQSVLDRISGDVGAYYAMLHPSENVDKVRLSVVGEEGIEFEYEFHGQRVSPPMKYLSESHLNSLGICLFLASARLFNTAAGFLLLDDIVTSFDHNHRRRLLRLIKEKFGDWQIILLTHERFWFELIQKEFEASGWLFKEATWDDENGIQLSASAADLRELIAEKRKKYDVSNDIRKLLEASLKEICHALEVKVPFRFNDDNERRMSGEFLSELRATANRKSVSLKGHASFSNLDASSLVANVGSHDNPGETIAGGDIDVALADIAALTDLFTCNDCGRYVDARRPVAGKDAISCKCGKKELDWKR